LWCLLWCCLLRELFIAQCVVVCQGLRGGRCNLNQCTTAACFAHTTKSAWQDSCCDSDGLCSVSQTSLPCLLLYRTQSSWVPSCARGLHSSAQTGRQERPAGGVFSRDQTAEISTHQNQGHYRWLFGWLVVVWLTCWQSKVDATASALQTSAETHSSTSWARLFTTVHDPTGSCTHEHGRHVQSPLCRNSSNSPSPEPAEQQLTEPLRVKLAVLTPTSRPKESKRGPPLLPALTFASVCLCWNQQQQPQQTTTRARFCCAWVSGYPSM
jgi:hypothetical protein